MNLEGSKVNLTIVATSDFEALRCAYEICKGACKHFETPFKFDFNTFIDKVEAGVFDKANAMASELLPKAEKKKK
jgi:hypothetical protein